MEKRFCELDFLAYAGYVQKERGYSESWVRAVFKDYYGKSSKGLAVLHILHRPPQAFYDYVDARGKAYSKAQQQRNYEPEDDFLLAFLDKHKNNG